MKYLVRAPSGPELEEWRAARARGADSADSDDGWPELGLCRTADPTPWFPDKGGSNEAAKALCGRCQVRVPCLDGALERGERFGIWGGFSEEERRRILARGLTAQQAVEQGAPARGASDVATDEVAIDDEDVPETLRQLCTRGGLLAHAGIALATAQAYAAKGLFIEPCGTGAYGARAYPALRRRRLARNPPHPRPPLGGVMTIDPGKESG